MLMRRIPAVLTFMIMQLVLQTSCAPVRVSMPALVLDGPALYIAGVYAGMHLEGVMDRGCMAGVGTLSLHAVDVAEQDKAAAVAEQSKAEGAATAGKAANTAEKGKTETKDRAASVEKRGEADAEGRATAAGKRENTETKDKAARAGEKEQTTDGAAGVTAADDTGGAPAFACSAVLDVLPDRKARVNGILECTSGRRMTFSLRNLGPDQGLGIARESQEGGLMVFFYHASESESKRRLPQVSAEMESLRAGAEK
jgi:hypothetical protein